MKQRIILSVAVLLGIMMTGCSESQPKQIEIFNVTAQKVRMVNQNMNGAYIGMAEASLSTPLSFQSIGQVEAVKVSEGDFVIKGQLLAVLDSRNAGNALRISEAKEKQAQDAYNRLESVYKNGSLTEIKWVEMQANLEQAQAMKQISLKSYNDCKLYAPFSGYIGKRNIEPGMSVTPGLPVFNLVKIEKIFVSISVPENEIAKIKKNQIADIEVSALDNKRFSGQVEEIGVVADIISHTYKVRIAVNNSDLQLKPGMVSNVFLSYDNSAKYPIIPLKAVLTDENNNKYIFVVTPNNHALIKQVKLGKLSDAGVVILDGLSPTDLVIVEGNHKLVNNSPLKIIAEL